MSYIRLDFSINLGLNANLTSLIYEDKGGIQSYVEYDKIKGQPTLHPIDMPQDRLILASYVVPEVKGKTPAESRVTYIDANGVIKDEKVQY